MIGSRKFVTTAAAMVLAAGVTSCSSSGELAATTIENRIARVTITFTENNGVEEPTAVEFSGAVNDKGTETQTFTGAAGGGAGTIVLNLAKGTMTGSFVEGDFQMNLDVAACRATPTSSGTITITTGIGDYVGASGDLTYTTAGTQVGAKDATGACLGTSKPPVSSIIVITGEGELTFGS